MDLGVRRAPDDHGALDQQGRRCARHDLRQLADGQLFQLGETRWTYPDPATPELDSRAGRTSRRYRTALLGLSGGIDSAVVAALACDALGPDHVYGVANPGPYSSSGSVEDAQESVRRTGIHFSVVPITPMMEVFGKSRVVSGLTEENLQARIRSVIWTTLANEHRHIVLACGNKTECSVGYSTMYGDTVGGYAPLRDVPKTLVWELARWRNTEALRLGQKPNRSRRKRP